MFSDNNAEINITKTVGDFQNIWRWNILLNNRWINEISREILRYFELSENENMTYQILWNAAKAVLSGKFIALSTHVWEKKKKAKINNLSMYFGKLKRKSKLNPKQKKGRKIKFAAEINAIENKNKEIKRSIKLIYF